MYIKTLFRVLDEKALSVYLKIASLYAILNFFSVANSYCTLCKILVQLIA